MPLPTAPSITIHLCYYCSKLIKQYLPLFVHRYKLITHTSLGFLSEVALQVLNQMGVPTKVFPAFSTSIRSLSTVHTVMLDKVGAHTEGFSTHLTFIGFLTSMDSLMLSKVHTLIIAFPTFTTLKWFFSSVDSPMLNEVGGLKEKFTTIITFVTSLGICFLLTVNVCNGTKISFLGRVLPWLPHSGVYLPPVYHAMKVINFSKFLTLWNIPFSASWCHPVWFSFIRNLLYYEFHIVITGFVIWNNRRKMKNSAISCIRRKEMSKGYRIIIKKPTWAHDFVKTFMTL